MRRKNMNTNKKAEFTSRTASIDAEEDTKPGEIFKSLNSNGHFIQPQ